jgi:hypothetical protein
MISSSVHNPIQTFAIKPSTDVFGSSGVTGYTVDGNVLVRMIEDGSITANYTSGTVVIPVAAGSDWVFDNQFDSLDIDAACIVTAE